METKEVYNNQVSIAICTYNGETFLREQLDSILNQDYAYITEIVCVDDNSTDGTWKILAEYAQKFKQIKIYRNEFNIGYVKNFELAMTLTTMPYIAIADQDDIWYPTKISKLINSIGSNLMVYSDSEYIDSAGNRLGNKLSDNRNLKSCSSCLSFALFNAISGHNILINRELLKYALPFNASIPHDFWLGFHAAQHSKIQVVNEVLVGYRQHNSNIIGAIGLRNNFESNTERIRNSHIRNEIFAQHTASHLQKEKELFDFLARSYVDKSFKMRLKRVSVFWKYNDELFLFKKRSKIRNLLYCFKAFWKYQ